MALVKKNSGMGNLGKYRAYQSVNLPDRTWPGHTIDKAPIWCSVDLRDGNQALMQPMSLQQKLEMFQLLVKIGFKQIEVGFPSASQVEYDFVRKLIEEDLIPDDVVIQVLTQSREHLIKRTFESLRGAKSAIVHLYNSTSTLQRRVVFKMNKQEILNLGVNGAKIIREQAAQTNTDIRFEYSPESFTGTELDFAVEICEAVMKELSATPERPVIINLPATVEMATPNVYADQIEWFCKNMKNRDAAIISLHAHNDRGTAVAATELALMAGADRVEGTLFGNGERTGNVDLITLALNMFSQGIDPGLELSNIDQVINIYERCTKLDVPPRHPYAGKLVYTAFSGSHQDAIKKGMEDLGRMRDSFWEVPYLPIDPRDVGRTYESIIRINSQSGKGGVAWVMETNHGYELPRKMQPLFGAIVQEVADRKGKELSNEEIFNIFNKEYLRFDNPIRYGNFNIERDVDGADSNVCIRSEISILDGPMSCLRGEGNGPLDAFCNAIKEKMNVRFVLNKYYEHSLNGNKGSSSRAVSYVCLNFSTTGEWWGVGVDSDLAIASVKAVISALNRMYNKVS